MLRNVCYVGGWAVVFCAVAVAGPPEGSESPTDAVRGTVDHVLRILDDPALKAPAKLLPRRRMLEEVIARRFDYAEMSMQKGLKAIARPAIAVTDGR